MKQKPYQNTLKLMKDVTSKKKRIVNFLGYKLIINKKVFPVDSDFSLSSKIIAKQIPKNPGKVLDIGTGTGVQAIIAAKKGAKKVIAADIEKDALKNAKENKKFHKLKNIEIRKSNLFSNIKKNEKFNLIIANLPFEDVSEKRFKNFLFDPDYKLHEKFLKKAKDHLLPNGKILISSGDIANEEKLLELIKKYNYKILKVKQEKFNNLIWKVYILRL